jgi:hypothetical protein
LRVIAIDVPPKQIIGRTCPLYPTGIDANTDKPGVAAAAVGFDPELERQRLMFQFQMKKLEKE